MSCFLAVVGGSWRRRSAVNEDLVALRSFCLGKFQLGESARFVLCSEDRQRWLAGFSRNREALTRA